MFQSHFHGRSFLAEKEFNQSELLFLINFAGHLKSLKQRNIPHRYLSGKNIALLFEKPSTRTRAAFTVAANDLGAQVEYLSAGDIQLGKKESIADTAKVLGSMFDAIEFRGYAQSTVEQLAQYSQVPVWNGLTDLWHPTQMLADFLTITEHFKQLKGLNLVYVGDGRNNVANSLLVTSALLGVNVRICAPPSLLPESAIIQLAQSYAVHSGSCITLSSDVASCVQGADILYTDVWVSMGEEAKIAERIALLQPYQINQEMLAKIGHDNFIILHCLPAFHDLNTEMAQQVYRQYQLAEMEITDQVFNSPQALQFQQAENRLHAIKAIMAATLGELFIPQPV